MSAFGNTDVAPLNVLLGKASFTFVNEWTMDRPHKNLGQTDDAHCTAVKLYANRYSTQYTVHNNKTQKYRKTAPVLST
jgi:hypothetical protein